MVAPEVTGLQTAMCQAHPAALPGPESLSPNGAGVAVVYAKKFHQELLDPSCKHLDSDVDNVVLEVIIDTIFRNIREVCEM